MSNEKTVIIIINVSVGIAILYLIYNLFWIQIYIYRSK